jgi:hypothetical protein
MIFVGMSNIMGLGSTYSGEISDHTILFPEEKNQRIISLMAAPVACSGGRSTRKNGPPMVTLRICKSEICVIMRWYRFSLGQLGHTLLSHWGIQ